MLGMNAPKAVVRGEYAKAVRKAVHDSLEAKENWKEPKDNHFAKLTPVPQLDVWPMYKTLWYKDNN